MYKVGSCAFGAANGLLGLVTPAPMAIFSSTRLVLIAATVCIDSKPNRQSSRAATIET